MVACGISLSHSWASLVAQMVKDPPAKQETWVQSLVREDLLEEGMATHFSILAWRIPWTEPGGLQSMGSQELDTTEVTKHAFCSFSVAQSCPTFGNPMDCSMPGLPVHHYVPELAETHIH